MGGGRTNRRRRHRIASESDVEDEFGSLEESDTDEAIVDESPAVKTSIKANKAAENLAQSTKAETMQSTPTSPRLTATNGNFSAQDDVFGDESNTSDPLSMVDADVLPIDRFAPYRFSFGD